jgi:hypothetical protein
MLSINDGSGSAGPTWEEDYHMPDVLELSRFRVAESNEEELRASYAGCARALEQFEGFKGVIAEDISMEFGDVVDS